MKGGRQARAASPRHCHVTLLLAVGGLLLLGHQMDSICAQQTSSSTSTSTTAAPTGTSKPPGAVRAGFPNGGPPFGASFGPSFGEPEGPTPPNFTEKPPKTNSVAGSKSKKPNKKLAVECLAAHNKFRRQHGAPDLEWDEKLEKFAQKRSQEMADKDGSNFGHPPGLKFGENLYWHSDKSTNCDYMVRGWYDEIELYNYNNPKFSKDVGHFTQLVWRDTKRVGCATAISTGPKGGVFLTCNYDPPGNVMGQFEQNVARKVGQSADSSSPKSKGKAPKGKPQLPTIAGDSGDKPSAPSPEQPDLVGQPMSVRPAGNSSGPEKRKMRRKNRKRRKKRRRNRDRGRPLSGTGPPSSARPPVSSTTKRPSSVRPRPS